MFRDFGYAVRVTSYGGDHGVDVFVFDSRTNDVIAVQVKRHASRIRADSIRSFGGALLENNVTKGIFITTSSFQPGAMRTARALGENGLQILLWNASDFYDRLGLVQRMPYGYLDDPTAPFYKYFDRAAELPVVYSRSW